MRSRSCALSYALSLSRVHTGARSCLCAFSASTAAPHCLTVRAARAGPRIRKDIARDGAAGRERVAGGCCAEQAAEMETEMERESQGDEFGEGVGVGEKQIGK